MRLVAGVRSFEPALFRLLEKLLEGPAAKAALKAIENAQREPRRAGEEPGKLDIVELARRLGRDQRNVRDQINAIEEAAVRIAEMRLPAEFDYPERGPGRPVELGLHAIPHRAWGHSEKFLLGFTKFTLARDCPVDLILLRRADQPRHYTASLADLAFELASIIQGSGVVVRRGHELPRVLTHPNPLIVLGSTESLDASKFRRPDFRRQQRRVAFSRGSDPQFRFEKLSITRFLNRCNPPQPVLAIESSDPVAPAGLITLLGNNEAASQVWPQLRLEEDQLPPEEFEFDIRFEIDDELDAINGTGDPQVLQGYYFDTGGLALAGD